MSWHFDHPLPKFPPHTLQGKKLVRVKLSEVCLNTDIYDYGNKICFVWSGYDWIHNMFSSLIFVITSMFFSFKQWSINKDLGRRTVWKAPIDHCGNHIQHYFIHCCCCYHHCLHCLCKKDLKWTQDCRGQSGSCLCIWEW